MSTQTGRDRVFLLGVRGSLPVSGAAFRKYGCATTCIYVRLGGRSAVLDGGTGLLSLPEEALAEPALPLLLTHPHADHLLGLPLCPYAMRQGGRLDIYAAPRGGLDAEALFRRIMSPPLWPVGPEALPARIAFHGLPATLDLDGISVRAMEGVHPGGVSVLSLSGGGRRVVLLTDCTLTPALRPKLLDFAGDCDLLLIDGQYSDGEWSARSSFGHNTWTQAARFGAECGAKQVRIIHHDPFRTDCALDKAAEELLQSCPRGAFGREGEVIGL